MIEFNTDSSNFAGLEPGDANVSYGVYPTYRGVGLVTRAVRMIKPIMASKGITRAVIRVERENTASRRVAQQCG